MGEQKKVVYILGPLDRPEDADAYHAADDMLTALGYNTLGLALIPEGLGRAAETRIADAMIASADAVVVLPKWDAHHDLVWLRHLAYCFDKPLVELRRGNPSEVMLAWLKHDLAQVLGEVSA
jgi:hypothetical protein